MNILFPVPAGQNDYNPNIRSLNAAAESLNTVITPGFINKILNVGNTINPTDMLLVTYANGTELFIQSESNGVVTLSPANQTVPFPFTNVQFVAQGGSDLNVGNNLNAPKLTVAAALGAITAGGLVWVLDAQTIENQPLTFNKAATIYAPNSTFVMDAISGAAFTQSDTGSSYNVFIYANTIEAAGGASSFIQNGSFSALLINAEEIVGPATINGLTFISSAVMVSGTITVGATGRIIFDVGFSNGVILNPTIGAEIIGKLGNIFSGTQTFLDQVISQQVESQETTGRAVVATDSNTTVNYMNAATGSYVFPNSGIPIGTKITFTQLSSGAVQFDSDGSSTILSYLNASPVRTNGLNAVAVAEQIATGIWMISGNLVVGIGP